MWTESELIIVAYEVLGISGAASPSKRESPYQWRHLFAALSPRCTERGKLEWLHVLIRN